MTAAILFTLLCAITLIVVKARRLDPDAGGYQDGWTTKAVFPDKFVHGLAACAITLGAGCFGVPALWAALITVAAGISYEFVQGYVSLYDIYADSIGALVALALLGLA